MKSILLAVSLTFCCQDPVFPPPVTLQELEKEIGERIPDQQVTLDQCLAVAMENQPRIQAAMASLRAAEAARETASLIDAATVRVADGRQLVAKTAEAATTAAGRVAGISVEMGRIVGAAEEQARAIGAVGAKLCEMDRVVQENAAGAERTAAAAAPHDA